MHTYSDICDLLRQILLVFETMKDVVAWTVGVGTRYLLATTLVGLDAAKRLGAPHLVCWRSLSSRHDYTISKAWISEFSSSLV